MPGDQTSWTDRAERRLEELADTVDDLRNAIYGTGTTIHPGIVGVIDDHNAELGRHRTNIDSINRSLANIKWVIFLSATGGGGLAAIVGKYIETVWP